MFNKIDNVGRLYKAAHHEGRIPAVFRKTAGIFLSTKSCCYPHKYRKRERIFKIKMKCAFALRQMRLFFVRKSRYLTYYPSRAPPFPIFEKIQHISRLEDNIMVIKYRFLDNTTSEVEVDDELGRHISCLQ